MLAAWVMTRRRDYFGSSRCSPSTSSNSSSSSSSSNSSSSACVSSPGACNCDGSGGISGPGARDDEVTMAASEDFVENTELYRGNEGYKHTKEVADLPINPSSEGGHCDKNPRSSGEDACSSGHSKASKVLSESFVYGEVGTWRTPAATRSRRWASLSGPTAATVAFVVHGLIAGMAFWLATDYPYFLVFEK